MLKQLRRVLLLSVTICILVYAQKPVMAQDQGPPALRSLAFYTVGGAAGGALLGVAFWMLDPLAPSADIRLSSLTGMGVGSIIGFVFGVMQLNKQAVIPYEGPPIPADMQPGAFRLQPIDRVDPSYVSALNNRPLPGVPLVNLNFKF